MHISQTVRLLSHSETLAMQRMDSMKVNIIYLLKAKPTCVTQDKAA